MDVNYDVSGNMPVATGASLLLHGLLAIAISNTFINSALAPQSIAVTVTLTQNNTAPTDSQHIASENRLARPGQLLESVREQQASARLAIMQAEAWTRPTSPRKLSDYRASSAKHNKTKFRIRDSVASLRDGPSMLTISVSG